MQSQYSRSNPSPRYRELVALYTQVHRDGDGVVGPEMTYAGCSTLYFADAIRRIIRHYGARTLLDYGAGKGRHYENAVLKLPNGRQLPPLREYWGFESVVCYDPAFGPHSQLPDGKFDGVICCDVLEHCPQEDLPWILDEIFGFARKFVFGNVASYPAEKTLPNGENAHCSVLPPSWWDEQIRAAAARHPEVHYHVQIVHRLRTASGESTFGAHFVQRAKEGNSASLRPTP